MNNPFDYFDAMYVINLDERVDRWQQVQEEFDKVGIKDKVIRFSGVESGELDGNVGCNKSHYNVIKLAKEKKHKNVLVFEDDVIFINNTLENLSKAVSQIDFKWHMFYLGANTHQALVKLKPNISVLKNAFALHAAAYSDTIYDVVLNNFKCKDHIGDMTDIYDVWVSRNIQPKYSTIVCSPIIATQRESFSDIQKQVMNYSFIEERAKNNIK